METAELVKKSGAVMLRGGAYKPRTSPYSFQGLGEEGLRYLREAGDATGLAIISEIVSPAHVEMMSRYVDVFQIGARNMQNFELLKAVGAQNKPVMVKRGLAATIEEWLMAAEYLLAHGAEDVILCERGIRTFETYTRHSLDISSIPVAKKLSHLPVIVDPSHATGIRAKVPPVALASVAAGADGLIMEVHPRPDEALSDGPQSLYPDQFERLMRDIEALSPVVEKELMRLPQRAVLSSRAAEAPTPAEETETLDVAFQGEHGAYSEMAVSRYFASDALNPMPKESFRSVFRSVLSGEAAYGIVPLENSLSGSIHENYDLLLQYPDVRICGEIKIRVIHSLIGLPDADYEDIEQVYSHPQGLAQCAEFLEQFPQWQQIPFYDTAGSVAQVARLNDKRVAAIANSEAARVHGMRVLKESIETNPQNYTRFAILDRVEGPPVANPQKASIVFSTPDEPGALTSCMQLFSGHDLNLKKIESRPIHGKPWRYMFYLDIDVENKEETFATAIEELREIAEDLRILGTYRAS
jgi:3-deoxy-7-phosphoheptulonate synthase